MYALDEATNHTNKDRYVICTTNPTRQREILADPFCR